MVLILSDIPYYSTLFLPIPPHTWEGIEIAVYQLCTSSFMLMMLNRWFALHDHPWVDVSVAFFCNCLLIFYTSGIQRRIKGEFQSLEKHCWLPWWTSLYAERKLCMWFSFLSTEMLTTICLIDHKSSFYILTGASCSHSENTSSCFHTYEHTTLQQVRLLRIDFSYW